MWRTRRLRRPSPPRRCRPSKWMAWSGHRLSSVTRSTRADRSHRPRWRAHARAGRRRPARTCSPTTWTPAS
ncbi:hypothetical protein D1781_16885 [Amnibacterium setariae]|uniref:Uncharacterized protein n=1 Tax=Amnibacterium setariae TaxID=2306585 RepID=A0A3A1TTJ3_9MICO|nr:hypothetical protein D1781_16885 [Amnibacterium setariae]